MSMRTDSRAQLRRFGAGDELGEGLEVALVVAEVEHDGKATRERGEDGEVDRTAAALADDVAVLERVAVDEKRHRQLGMGRTQEVDVRDELRGAFVGGVLVANDEQQGLGGAGRREEETHGQRRAGTATKEDEEEVNHEGTRIHTNGDESVGSWASCRWRVLGGAYFAGREAREAAAP